MKKQTQKITKAAPAKAPAKKTAKPASGKTEKTAGKAPAKNTAPAKKAAKTPAKNTAPAKKAAKTPAKAAPAKKAAKTPAKAAPVKKTAKSAAVKTPAKAAPVKKSAAVRKSAAKPVSKKTVPEQRHETEHPVRKLKLSKADKKFYRELLMHARASFGEQIQVHVDEALSSRKDSAGERAGMATHMADLGSDNFRHDFELGLLTDEVDVLEMIDEALQRIEDSEYGVCLDCGAIIPRERLEAKPYARYCTKCKSKREEMEDSRYHR